MSGPHDDPPPETPETRSATGRVRCLLELAGAAERLARLPIAGRPVWLGHEVSAALSSFLAAASAAENVGAEWEELLAAARPARSVCARSSVIAHAQTWPLGQVGDFELIERLLDGRPKGEPGTLAHALDAAVLQLPIAWHHRAKVNWQAGLVRRRLGGHARPKVLSIGCGGSPDLARLEAHELARLDVTLSDFEARALELSRTRLAGRVASLALVPGDALRVARRADMRGPFDLILMGGLLDGLPDGAASVVLDQAITMLGPGGMLGATNVAAGNPWRLLLELVCDWPLVERSAADLTRLLEKPELVVDVSLDPSRLTWLATATNLGAPPRASRFA